MPTKSLQHQAESAALESKIRVVKDIKAETMEEILEAERQVMLWEKKTQLERETQASEKSSDPTSCLLRGRAGEWTRHCP